MADMDGAPTEEVDLPDIGDLDDDSLHFRSAASVSGETLSRESSRVLDALRPLLRGLRVTVARDPERVAGNARQSREAGWDTEWLPPETFDYETLSKRPPIPLLAVPVRSFSQNATESDIVNAGKESIRHAGGVDVQGGIELDIPAFRKIIVGTLGLSHGLRPYGAIYEKLDNPLNADIMRVAGDVLKHSIPVNELWRRRGDKATDRGAIILLGAARTRNNELVPVVSIVRHSKGTLADSVTIYPLKSVNARKIERPMFTPDGDRGLRPGASVATQVTIPDLLSASQEAFPDRLEGR